MITAPIIGANLKTDSGLPILEGKMATRDGHVHAKISAWVPMPDELWRLVCGASVYAVVSYPEIDGEPRLHIAVGQQPVDEDEGAYTSMMMSDPKNWPPGFDINDFLDDDGDEDA